MKDIFDKFRKMVTKDEEEESEDGFLEITSSIKDSKVKVEVKSYQLIEYKDVKPILDDLREGYTIALIDIAPLKEKDIIELKRAIGKMKKVCEAIGGDLAGFSADYIVATPSFAKIARDKKPNQDL
ncbi:MAG: cell division protein SepF [Candidatus Nanoarchaeia archaeon]|nr:cell division protein SepF [Candidatus Nanoarchaeia archaeon]